MLASLRVLNKPLKDCTILFQGAGEAALGIANLSVMAMMREGVAYEQALSKVWLVDSRGLIVKDRPKGGINEHKLMFAHDHPPVNTLEEAVDLLKPNILIGAAAISGAFTPQIITKMAKFNERPVIFALSNPTSKAECTAADAYTYSEGRAVFASGSPFPPFEINGKTLYPGQGNNSYIFPGIALGVICGAIRTIPDDIFLMAAQSLAELVTDDDLAMGSLYPPLQNITSCSIKIAEKILHYAYKNGMLQ